MNSATKRNALASSLVPTWYATSTSNSSANNDNQSNATNNIGPITVHTPINIYVTCGCCGKKHKCRIDGMNGDCDEEDEEDDD